MACGSCGGARARTVTLADGQQRLVEPKRTRYSWWFIPSGGGEKVEFRTQEEADTYMKSGNAGSVMMGPASA